MTYNVFGGTFKPYSTQLNFVLAGPIVIKLGMIDYVGDPYSDTHFS